MLLTASALGIASAFFSVSLHSADLERQTLTQYRDAPLTLTGTVLGQPDDRQTMVKYTLDATQLTWSGTAIPVTGRVLVTDRVRALVADPGDTLAVKGTLVLPADDEEFSYKAYLAMDGITATMDTYAVRITAQKGFDLQRLLWRIRSVSEARIGTVFPEPGASLLAGLLTGSRKGLPQTISDDFRTTGISHIIAISGSNITIILSVMGGLLFFLPLRWRFIPCVTGITLFTLLVGAEASVVRAAIMGILGLVALQAGRLTQIRLMILWTMFFMLMHNPAQLWHDMGFHLSFLAVIGLAELQELIEPIVRRLPKAAGIQEAMLATLAAQVTTTPWSAAQFGQISLISPLTNILVAPLVPIAMLFGFLGTVMGLVFLPLGQLIGLPGVVALDLIVLIAELTADVPYAAIMLPPWAQQPMLLSYVLLIIGLIRLRKKKLTTGTDTRSPHFPNAAGAVL